MSLGPDSTLQEFFQEIMPEEGVRVVPVSMKDDGETSRLMIAIAGTPAEAHTIMAALMGYVNDMSEVAEKAAEQEKGPRLVGSDGELLTDDGPDLLVP